MIRRVLYSAPFVFPFTFHCLPARFSFCHAGLDKPALNLFQGHLLLSLSKL